MFLAIAFFACPTANARLEVVDCDASAMEDINWVIEFSEAYTSAIFERADFIPSKYVDKLRDLLQKGKLKCSSKGLCNNTDSNYLGFHSTGPDIKLCWDNLRSQSTPQNRCDLVETLYHEKAHAAGVPDEAKHNTPARGYDYVPAIDMVYRFGAVARTYCAEITLKRDPADWIDRLKPLESSNSGSKLAIGKFCSTDTQCSSNKCEKGVCTCNVGKDCPGNGSMSMRCVNRLGKNFCAPPANSLGSYCKKNNDCSIGTCNNNLCVCDKDSECEGLDGIGSNPRCAKPLGAKNFCQSTSVAKGNYCQKDSDCASGKCQNKLIGNKKDFCL